MDLSIRPMTPAERNYCYTQSHQINVQSGCIGHLRADFGSGEQFYSSWDDHCSRLNTDEFKSEIDRVINALRTDKAYGGILVSRRKMESYCWKHPESSFGNNREYGIRVDTEQYTYLLRLNPNPGEYNLYAYCYVKAYLDKHLEKAARGIRFITPDYGEKFVIPDGDSIRITTSEGKELDHICRFIDEYHVQVGYGSDPEIFHICQFAELLERAGSTVIPLRSNLPDRCFAADPDSGEIVVVTKGATKWTPTEQHPEGISGQEGADQLNAQLGVTKAQAAAMLAGITSGWAERAADPAYYDAEGKPCGPA